MTRDDFDMLISDHVDFQIPDGKTGQHIWKVHNKALEKDYPPISGRSKELHEFCNVMLAYADGLTSAQTAGLEVNDEDFGNIVYSVMLEIIGKD